MLIYPSKITFSPFQYQFSTVYPAPPSNNTNYSCEPLPKFTINIYCY